MSATSGTEFKDQAELAEAFIEEITAVAKDTITIRLDTDIASLLGILGIMQLALRHPGLAESPSAAQFARWARAIEKRLAGYGPAIARICSMGWSGEFDRE